MRGNCEEREIERSCEVGRSCEVEKETVK